MKICLIGKYPPIQGGVSKSTFIASHDLARNGHKVHVITNSEEVEPAFRLLLSQEDIRKIDAVYGDGYVKVANIDPINSREYSHIPYSSSFETRLFGLGSDLLAEGDFDVIIGWYLQPYGFVASILSKKFNIPLMLMHAGSDIGRLIKHPQLSKSYEFAFSQATFVISQKESPTWNILREHGVQESQLLEVEKGRVMPKYFSGQHNPIDLDILLQRIPTWIASSGMTDSLQSKILEATSRKFNPELPTVGIYGKIGEVKGSFDLVKVLSKIAEEGVLFNFCVIPLGYSFTLNTFFTEICESRDLLERLYVLPPVPNWKIPKVIAAFDITCFLERDFDIEFHTPQIPLEILASGSCLVCSKEIIQKMFFKEIIADGINLVEIEDPKDISKFEQKLKALIKNKVEVSHIARRGKITYDTIDANSLDHSSVANTIELGLKLLPKKKSLSTLERILEYKNDFVIDCFLKQYSFTRDEAKDIFQETLKWLYLCGHSYTESNVPAPSIFGGTKIIDEMWHTFILCTKDYYDFCEKYIGKFIHHQPSTIYEKEELKRAYLLNPQEQENKLDSEFRELMSYVYDLLGEETTVKWFDTYQSKYSVDRINSAKV